MNCSPQHDPRAIIYTFIYIQVELDELRYAKSRLNAYKGLASESYISLSSDDPIITSFQLAKELRLVASKEKHYRVSISFVIPGTEYKRKETNCLLVLHSPCEIINFPIIRLDLFVIAYLLTYKHWEVNIYNLYCKSG